MSKSRWTAALCATMTAAAMALAVPAHTQAQIEPEEEEWSRNLAAEARLGTTFPVGDLADIGGESGLAFTADLLFNFDPRWTVYAGWGFHDFTCDECPDDLRSSGPHLGAKYLFDWEGDALPWARAGFMFNRADAFQGGTDVRSDMALGLEASTGLDFRVSERLSLTPSLGFHYYSADLPVEDIGMSYFLLDLGAHYHF